MERALVIGASGGIGRAVHAALERQLGAGAVGLSRSADGLDITRPETVEAALGALEGPFDLIFVATGALAPPGARPEKSLREIEADQFAQQFAVNATGPALILRHAPRLMPRDRRAVFAALSARVGSIGDNGMGGWYSYRASKAALNQVVHTAAIELKRSHKMSICAALHPGTVATSFTADYAARHKTVPPDEAAANLLSVVAGLRPGDSGGFFDWAGKTVPW